MSSAITHQLICKQPGRYLAWPTIAADGNGTLYTVFSGDRDGHVCPFGKIFLTHSADGGRTWSEPEVVADTPLDDRDPGLCIAPDGTLVLSWVTSHFAEYRSRYERFMTRPDLPENRWLAWEEKIATISPGDVRRWAPSDHIAAKGREPQRSLGFWTQRSHDGGRTWDAPTTAPVYAPHGPCATASGDLFYAGLGRTSEGGSPDLGIARSRDQGRTWQMLANFPSILPYPGEREGGVSRLGEPHLVCTRSGRIIGMARYEESGAPAQSYLWQFNSDDQGATWSEPRRSDILGKPPHLLELKSGRMLLSYGFRLSPFGQRASFSDDEGCTWSKPLVLRDDAPNRDLGYASAAECADGTIACVYYQVEKEGETPSLMMSRYTLPA